MTPKFLKNQLGRSLKNLGVECVDVYYLHNPETQLSEVSKEEFLNRVREAFTFLESAVEAGEIQYYGMATWNGFRQDARVREAMQLGEISQIAKKLPVAGIASARAGAIQPGDDGSADAGQSIAARASSNDQEGASELDISLIASASLLQGQVAKNLPEFVAEALGLASDAERALQFVRSSPGNYDRTGGHVPAGARESQRAPGERPSRHRGRVHQTVCARRRRLNLTVSHQRLRQ